MSVAQKQAHQRDRAREPSVVCPVCETQTTAADLIAHVETRCSGPREPNPAAKWVTWSEAMALGVQAMWLSRWVKRGEVRAMGERGDRRYLLRDIAVRFAARSRR
jgi:hypothetical protein